MGAITVPQYRSPYYLSDRTATIAKDDHVLGGCIIEIENKSIFYLRQVQFNATTGAFTDLNKKYHTNKVEKVTAQLVQLGDFHVGSTDPRAEAAGHQLCKLLNPDYITLEDFFDGICVNPHELHRSFATAKLKKLVLKDELDACYQKLISIVKSYSFQKCIVMKYGNHEHFLYRWLDLAEYAKDPVNHYEGLCLAKATFEGHLPFEFAMKVRGLNKSHPVEFLNVNSSFKINGIENAAHGHLGQSGKRNPTLEGIRNAYGKCNVAHSHSGAIHKGVYRAGTKTKMFVGYNNGPSTWTHSDVVQHRDGSRQLVTSINGKFMLDKK